jgi:hypothetical protein
VEYAVYIAVPLGDDAARIAAGASSLPRRGFAFRIREKSDPSEATAAELFFRIKGVDHADEALARALEVYEAGRKKAGLPLDERAEPSLVPVAGSWT